MEATKDNPVTKNNPKPVPTMDKNVIYVNEMTDSDRDLLRRMNLRPLSPVKPIGNFFYPKAIQYLIELYQMKYREMKNKTVEEIRSMDIWDDISKKMHEGFYSYTAKEVKEKFAELRQQYFNIKNMIDLKCFDYFAQFHEIYRDESIDAINHNKPMLNNQQQHSKMVPEDEALWQNDTNKEEIGVLHTEPGFQDIIQKELHGINENSERGEAINEQSSSSTIKHESDNKKNKSKRLKTAASPDQDSKTDSDYVLVPTSEELNTEMGANLPHIDEMGTLDTASNDRKDMTLAEYNSEQERRHLEKMKLLEKSQQIQERGIAMQQTLLEQITKRL